MAHPADIEAMREAAKAQHKGDPEHFWWYVSYEEIVAAFGAEVVGSERLGSYQGDLLFLLRDGERWGFLTTGYGSCSGCDSLEAADGEVSAAQSIADDLFRGVHWEDDAAGMDRHLAARDEGNDYWFGDEEGKAAVATFRSLLGVSQ